MRAHKLSGMRNAAPSISDSRFSPSSVFGGNTNPQISRKLAYARRKPCSIDAASAELSVVADEVKDVCLRSGWEMRARCQNAALASMSAKSEPVTKGRIVFKSGSGG